SSWLSPPPNHLHNFMAPKDGMITYCTPPHLHIMSMPALCPSLSSLGFMPSPTPTCPIKHEHAAVAPLYSPSPPP
ncbi:hypothetical protein K443DRAFT_27566, partial [Laccaria amethystina LaAM-08-1]